MIAPELVNELQRLNREEKLQVIRFLNEELSDDVDQYLQGRRVFKMSPRFIASDEAISTLMQLENEFKDNG